MESLQVTRLMSCKLSANKSRKACSFRPSRQLGSSSLSRRSFQNGKLTVARSDITENGSGFGGLDDSSNSNNIEEDDDEEEVEEEIKEKNGLILGLDRDDCGSVIALHLIPSSGIFFPRSELLFFSCHLINNKNQT